MRAFLAIAAAALVLVGIAAPHHHAAEAGAHECMACTVGGALEARDATPVTTPPSPVATDLPLPRQFPPVTGSPLGAVPGQSPPHA